MEWLFLCFIMSVVTALIAGSKGRNAFVWFIYGLIIWPLALIHALVMGSRTTVIMQAQTPVILQAQPPVVRIDNLPPTFVKVCPDCAEDVRGAAAICRFCGHRFDRTDSAPSATTHRTLPPPADNWRKAAPPASTAPGTFGCPNCRAELKAWATRCGSCGYDILARRMPAVRQQDISDDAANGS